MHCYLCWV